MPSNPDGVQAVLAPMRDEDRRALAQAKADLLRPSLAIRIASGVGMRIDTLLRHVPGGLHDKITDLAEAALRRCLDVALRTLSDGATAAPSGIAAQARARSRGLHKLAVIGTGAAGGAFGLLALPAELPVTTTLMFRSICAIAQSKGESLGDPAVQLQCLLVLALGGPAPDDDEAQWGYFMVRGTLAQAVSRASSELASKGLGAHSSSVLLQLIRQIASRLSVQISEQIAAKSVPAIGAVVGASVNAAFIDHFQKIADAHFTVRALERRYGEACVRACWEALPE
ncbi:EcsC family protein [Pararobbsia silviterrae]|uniref:EcsC family protein n=1 Tax=Pararobbsia silviterrae TaxID=1792498 RepID=A0A494Y8C3_9BURK|nr:EcsC family protein [Pararobbsia silviterrae]RKP58894.1 EcsC family protein [Pararobbsia silviterrae]